MHFAETKAEQSPEKPRSFLADFLKYWLPVVTIAVIIFILSSFGANTSDAQSNFFVDGLVSTFPDLGNFDDPLFLINLVRKSAHFAEFALFGLLLARALKNTEKTAKNFFFLSVILSIFYAATDEIHQSFVPGRSCQLSDVLLDTLAAIVGIGIYFLFTKLLTRRKK